jgi:hypothetical protein
MARRGQNDRAYFDITGGRERWLYRVARKHSGGAGEAGFAISMPTLFEKSGAEGQYRRFKFELAKIVDRDELPGYALTLEQAAGKREPSLRMRRRAEGEASKPRTIKMTPATVVKAPALKTSDPAIAPVPPVPLATAPDLFDAGALIRRSIVGLSTRATAGFVADDTLALLQNECPDWDYHNLHTLFREWIGTSIIRKALSKEKRAKAGGSAPLRVLPPQEKRRHPVANPIGERRCAFFEEAGDTLCGIGTLPARIDVSAVDPVRFHGVSHTQTTPQHLAGQRNRYWSGIIGNLTRQSGR